jgi:hypothetical protein
VRPRGGTVTHEGFLSYRVAGEEEEEEEEEGRKHAVSMGLGLIIVDDFLPAHICICWTHGARTR